MTTPGSSFNPTPLDHEVNLGVRNHARGKTSQFLLLLLMPPDRQGQIEAHGIHHGNGLDCMSAIIRSFEHHSGNSTIWLGFTPILRENTLGVVRNLPPPSINLTR
ncbi:hypothetical protein TNCV_4269801 [Trichonephila clavipes]|nr:hypothetical protein TNCV_4269801 [Trichonephila clavipes]